MTAEHLDWDPNNPTYSQQEAAMTNFRGTTISRPDRGQSFVINSLSSMTSYAADITDNENFGLALDMQVTISVATLDTTKTKPGGIHSKAGKPVDAEMLAKRWMIPAKRANATVTKTTQGGSEHAYTLPFPVVSRLMTTCSVIPGCRTLASVTRCLLELSPKVETSVHKYSPPVSVGHVPTQ